MNTCFKILWAVFRVLMSQLTKKQVALFKKVEKWASSWSNSNRCSHCPRTYVFFCCNKLYYYSSLPISIPQLYCGHLWHTHSCLWSVGLTDSKRIKITRKFEQSTLLQYLLLQRSTDNVEGVQNGAVLLDQGDKGITRIDGPNLHEDRPGALVQALVYALAKLER